MPDPILLWNEIALEANRVSHTNVNGEQAGPPLSARALAIVHLAMYDAYGVLTGSPDLPRYDAAGPAAAGASPDDAVTGAAYKALTTLYPSQTPFFDEVLSAAAVADAAAFGFGEAVAAKLLADRAGDPGVGSATYKVPSGRGKHRPDPDNPTQGLHAPDYGRLSPGFGITARFELAAPPFNDGNDAEYLAALKQVRRKGIKPELMGTLPAGLAPRTMDETVSGVYWGYDGSAQLGTPPRFYNRIVRKVAKAKGNDVAKNARLFALVNVAMADAGILAWDQKYVHEFWRPVVGLREHDRSMGPKGPHPANNLSNDGDPFWLPLGAPNSNKLGKNFTPPFPAYPSGHATFGAAALHVTRLFYGQGGTFAAQNLHADHLFDHLSMVSEEFNGATTDNAGTVRPRHARTFPGGLWKMIEENSRSRVHLGVHWVFDGFLEKPGGDPDVYRQVGGKYVGGVPLGLLIAEDVFGVNGKGPAKSGVGPRAASAAPASERAATHSSSYLR